MPFGVMTVTSTMPVPAGETDVMLVAEFTVKLVAGVAPKFTAVAPVKLVPVMVTEVPAAPDVGFRTVTVGTAALLMMLKVRLLDVLAAVVTVTVAAPASAIKLAGTDAVSEVALT